MTLRSGVDIRHLLRLRWLIERGTERRLSRLLRCLRISFEELVHRLGPLIVPLHLPHLLVDLLLEIGKLAGSTPRLLND